MRTAPLILCLVAACTATTTSSTADPAAANAGQSQRTSRVWFDPGPSNNGAILRIGAGPVQVRHHVPPSARLRATILEGLDDNNRHLRYSFESDGTYNVEISGRYRHTVTGSIADLRAGDRLESEVRYLAY